ncbi:MAG TPA: DEAD/DEAH box helicase, partial [Planctomycetota bacterium]|nr:DEAD/DEAH box helicase [Planctomycetota bacterium]
GPTLVVAPKTLLFNWESECKRFAPTLRVLIHHGNARARTVEPLTDTDLVVTTYGTMRLDIELLSKIEFDLAVLDEAQAIKNPASQAAKAARLLKAKLRLALTGTPVENRLGDLLSIFDYLNPGLVEGSRALRSLGAEDDVDAARIAARALRPFMLRRTKEEVLRDLPPKTEQTLLVELEGTQKKEYEKLRGHYQRTLLATVDDIGLDKARMNVLEALLRLRQAACHVGLIDETRVDEPCAKIETLLPLLEEVLSAGHKALVFSQFTSFLAILRADLDKRGIAYEYLDGQTRDRAARVTHFQEDAAVGLFLVSLKAGGVGLNLTAADYVFLLDPWWNPAVERQAVDRAHRIGQTRAVSAYRLVARDTVEEKVLALQDRKKALADALFAGEGRALRELTREDLEWVLS